MSSIDCVVFPGVRTAILFTNASSGQGYDDELNNRDQHVVSRYVEETVLMTASSHL